MGKHILSRSNINKTINYIRKNGIKHAYYAAMERIGQERKSDYIYDKPDGNTLATQREDWKRFPYRFSIVVPAYETKEEHLREMIDSVRGQSYERWELIIADAGDSSRVEDIVAQYQDNENERRIRYIKLIENRGISENSNAGIEAAEGDYVALLDHDDILTADALYEMAAAIQQNSTGGEKPVLLYSDEDKFDDNSSYFKEPHIKNDFNLDLILSNNYICHLMMVETKLIKSLKLRKKYDGAQDYDLVLRVVSGLMDEMPINDVGKNIVHVPKVLYHWRCHRDSTAENTASKSYAYEAGKSALEDFCKRRGWNTRISHALHLGFYRIEYLPDMFSVRPEVGIIGGRVLDRHNKITSGIYNEKGERLYKGLHKEYSGGSTHRASLMQECSAVDIRCMRLCSELQPLFTEITGVMYKEGGKQMLADVSGLSCDEEGYKKLSMKLGDVAAKRGYLVVWNPELAVKM
ncbi:MAG: glycosyltransferase [Lachnospiraceae bacterium]|nr:glycosyltransferase [Lachnospiraceae bacterium]